MRYAKVGIVNGSPKDVEDLGIGNHPHHGEKIGKKCARHTRTFEGDAFSVASDQTKDNCVSGCGFIGGFVGKTWIGMVDVSSLKGWNPLRICGNIG